MRILVSRGARVGPVAGLALVAALASCHLPTDQSIGAYLTITAAEPVVVRGRQIDLHAHLWFRHGTHDSTDVPNVQLRWTSADPRKAALTASPHHGTIVVTGVNPGTDTIAVTAPAFGGAKQGVFVLRVSDALAVDSVRPTTVHYGDQVTIYGVGIAHTVFAQLGSVTLLPDTFSTAGDSIGLSQRSFWVPFPADTGRVLALGEGEFRTSSETISVLHRDLYDPNDAAPAVIDLNAAPPFAALPAVRFYNPALAFENLPVTGVDWFRFQAPDSTSAYTWLLDAPGLDGTDSVYVGDAGRGTTGRWSAGAGFADCKGYPFRPATVPFGGLIAPMSHLHGPASNLVAAFTSAGVYSLTAVKGYLVIDSTIPPDRFESSSDCLFADENFADPAKHIDLGQGFADRLTIDHPFEVDWLRVHVPGAVPATATVSIAARPISSTSPSSQLDLYLLAVPTGSSGLTQMAADTSPGSSKSVTAVVPPGDYYVVVVDADGVITPYSICATLQATCVPPSGTRRRATPPPGLDLVQLRAVPHRPLHLLRSRGTPAARRGA